MEKVEIPHFNACEAHCGGAPRSLLLTFLDTRASCGPIHTGQVPTLLVDLVPMVAVGIP